MIKGGVASIYVTDMKRAVEFYQGALGLTLRSQIGDEWAEIQAGSSLILGLHIARPPKPGRQVLRVRSTSSFTSRVQWRMRFLASRTGEWQSRARSRITSTSG